MFQIFMETLGEQFNFLIFWGEISAIKRLRNNGKNSDGGQNLERRNVERPVFRNFGIANIKIKKD